MSIPLNTHGEIVDVQEADQFQPAKSQFECGFFACAMARSMARPGDPPTHSMSQVIADAESWYAQYDGSDSITNTDGMTLEQLYELLAQIGLHYQATAVNINVVKLWVLAGYLMIVALVEGSVYDLALGDMNPYPWTPSGTHIILVTGVAADGNVLVRDSANCTNLYDPNSLRPGPRRYDANKLQLVSATVVPPPWMPRPTSANPPTGGESMIPQGWHDDGTTLVAPNGHKISQGFRAWILGQAWDPANQPQGEEFHADPLEYSNPALGAGQKQCFTWTTLEWTAARGVFEAWQGQEIAKLLQMLQAAKTSANIADAVAIVTQLRQTSDAALAKVLADLQVPA